jgi:hypothetical protein
VVVPCSCLPHLDLQLVSFDLVLSDLVSRLRNGFLQTIRVARVKFYFVKMASKSPYRIGRLSSGSRILWLLKEYKGALRARSGG